MASFYADENFREPLVEALRRLCHDKLTRRHAGRASHRIADAEILADALALGRVLLTQNRKHVIQLDREGRDYCGIVVCKFDRDAEALARRIAEAVLAQEN